MKTLARDIPLTIAGQKYVCDILLGTYAEPKRPAIILVEARPGSFPAEKLWNGEPVAIASVNVDSEFLEHLSQIHFPMKNYSENAGLWEQLLLLTDSDGFPLFLATHHSIISGYVHIQIGLLGPSAAPMFEELIEEINTRFAHSKKEHPNG